MNIDFYNHELTLHQEGAIFWRTYNVLIVSDIHFGKAATFQRYGIPIPNEVDEDNLQKLQQLLQQTQAEQLIIAGDMVHTPFIDQHQKQKIIDRLESFKLKKIILVTGNHDKKPFDPKLIEEVEQLHLNGIQILHEPHINTTYPTISGHLHPVINIKLGLSKKRCKCFVKKNSQLILPSFGAFTGGMNVQKKEVDQVWIIADQKIYPLK